MTSDQIKAEADRWADLALERWKGIVATSGQNHMNWEAKLLAIMEDIPSFITAANRAIEFSFQAKREFYEVEDVEGMRARTEPARVQGMNCPESNRTPRRLGSDY